MTIKFTGVEAEAVARPPSGQWAHAEGSNTTASGAMSHAEGSSTTASGMNSHAEGSSTSASTSYTHAEGSSTTASGTASHAEGGVTTASGNYSHAEGSNTTASGSYSSAGGYYSKADAYGAWARGGVFPTNITANRAQVGVYALSGASPSAGAAFALTFDGSQTLVYTGAGTNVLVIPQFGLYRGEITWAARHWGMNAAASTGVQQFVVHRDGSNTLRLVNSIGVNAINDTTSAGTFVLSIDTTNYCVKFQITPTAGYSVNAVALLTTAELVGTS